MADWDSADLLARVKRDALRPAADELMDDATWYIYLSEAQVWWHGIFSTMLPGLLWGAPALMSTADGGLTYTFPLGVTPSKVQIYESLNGRLLIPCAPWNAGGDYVWEGNKIRFPRNLTKTFPDGAPYARYVAPPTKIDAGTQPVLVPDWTRILLPPRACIIWCERGGLRDPQPFEKKENDLWIGNMAIGKPGILVTLKTQNPFAGAEAIRGDGLVSGLNYLAARYWQ